MYLLQAPSGEIGILWTVVSVLSATVFAMAVFVKWLFGKVIDTTKDFTQSTTKQSAAVEKQSLVIEKLSQSVDKNTVALNDIHRTIVKGTEKGT